MGKASTDDRSAAWAVGMMGAAATSVGPWVQEAFAAESERIVEAFNWTVVFLMAMPYATLACCAGWIVYRYTRSAGRAGTNRRGFMLLKKENVR